MAGSGTTPCTTSAATRSRCGRSRLTFGRSDVASGRGEAGALAPEATVARRPPGRRTAKLFRVTSPPTVSNTASQPETSCKSEEHTSELQSHHDLVCRLLLEK